MPLITFNINNKIYDKSTAADGKPRFWVENSWKVTTLITDIEECLKKRINPYDDKFLTSVKDYAKVNKRYSAAQEEHVYKVINKYKDKKVIEKNDEFFTTDVDDQWLFTEPGDED